MDLYIDLNCDLGESFGAYAIGNDDKVLDYVTSANIACGFHAGDALVMKKTVELAIEKGVGIGAHPGLPDLMGFGRRIMTISEDEATAYTIYQVGALKAFAEAKNMRLQHVKPHGALYNMAATDYKLAYALAKAVYSIDPSLVFIGLANSQMVIAAKELGLPVANEVFADRAYQNDGTLVPRNIQGSVIHDPDICVERVLRMVKEKKVTSIDRIDIDIKADTVCIHGDNAKALEFTRQLKLRLHKEDIKLLPIGQILQAC